MALTEITTPDDLMLSDNPNKLVLQTDNYVISNGSKTSFDLTIINYAAVDGRVIELTFPDGTVVHLTSATTLDETGNNFPTTAANLGAYRAAMLAALQANYYINRAFVLSLTGSVITFQAREVGAKNNVSKYTDVAVFTFSPSVLGSNAVYNQFYRAYVHLWVETVYNSGSFVKLNSIDGIPGTDSKIYFDLGERIKSFVENDYRGPLTTYEICTQNERRYYYEYYEVVLESGQPYKVTKSKTFRVLKGALRHVGFYRSASFTNATTGYLATSKMFLTWKKKRWVVKQQNEWLYWYNNFTRQILDPLPKPPVTEGILLKTCIYYTDGTNAVFTVLTDTMSAVGDVVCYPAGYTNCGIEAFTPAKTVRKYELWLQGATTGTIITETITFMMVLSETLEKFFYYENSLGGYETLRTTGKFDFGIDYLKDEGRQAIPLDAEISTLLAEVYQLNKFYRYANTGRTGGLYSKAEIVLLIEFLMSEKYITIYPSSGQTYQVTIGADKMPLYQDENSLWGIEFTYSDAFFNPGHSTY